MALPQCMQNLWGMEADLLRFVSTPNRTSTTPALPLIPQYHIQGSEMAVEPL
jgi:hypothetical protein